jgi:inosine/xanthosine triphosphatase
LVFKKHFKNVKVIGVSVSSGVAKQPMSDDEMYRGALTRAKGALQRTKNADFGVGIEGGVHKYSYGWFERSLIVIVNRKGDIGIGASGGLALPNSVINRIHKGKTLEQAVDELFGTKQIGKGIGMFGIFTKGVVTRTSGVSHGVAFALARFLHEGLYK